MLLRQVLDLLSATWVCSSTGATSQNVAVSGSVTLRFSFCSLGYFSVTATPGTTAQLSCAVANASSYTLIWNGGAAETNATSPITKTGLTNGTSYSYSVMAVGDAQLLCYQHGS